MTNTNQGSTDNEGGKKAPDITKKESDQLSKRQQDTFNRDASKREG